MMWEETIIIEDTKENTFVINNDNHREIINIKEESKVKIKRAYLIDRNIQVAGYTHSNKSHKRKIRVKELTHNNYHCNEKRSNKPSIRNTTQKCDNYNINYTHSKYRTSDNYDNDNYNCNYKN